VGGAAWVMVVLASALIVVALVVFVAPLRRGSGPSVSARNRPAAGGPSSEALARGFSYMHVPSRLSARRGGVHERLARAFARIDAVDPHAAPRRIGEALVQAGVAEPPAAPPILPPRITPPAPPGDLR
jgi:hypothetical protein